MGDNEAAALSLIREGAQGDDAVARSMLIQHVQAFSREYADRIADSTAVGAANTVASQGQDWINAVRNSGRRETQALRTSARHEVDASVTSDGLTASAIHDRVDTARLDGNAERENLAKDVWNQQGHAGIDYFSKKLSVEKAIDEGSKESLTQQVFIGPLDDSDLKHDPKKP